MNERAIFTVARQLPSESERSTYLDQACGNDANLRIEVEALLREEEKLGNFLESPAAGLAALEGGLTEEVDCEGQRRVPESPDLGMTEVIGSEGQEPETPSKLGDFRILNEIGRGGMGIVYLAEQLSLGRRVALKVLRNHAWHDLRHLQRFEREATAIARLHHTNIVPVYGIGEQDGLHYFVMQFIEGHGLDDVLNQMRKDRSAKLPSPNSTGSGRNYYRQVACRPTSSRRRTLSGDQELCAVRDGRGDDG
jgi:hypothetical protein